MLSQRLAQKQGFIRKRCSKCGGNIFVDSDFHGWYEGCLQCGHTVNLAGVAKARPKAKICV
ncbi:MAG TPA: hypothetical protein VLH15_09695 [Dehalococcoidales bacterium]|nr:hypothetical protein [Dehalococcoidales bacterium]